MGSSFEETRRKMFDAYVYDYLLKKNCPVTAEIFLQESELTDPTIAIDSPESFLAEWWSLFHDIYFAPSGSDEVTKEGPPNLTGPQSSNLSSARMFEGGNVNNSQGDNGPSDAARSKPSTTVASPSRFRQHQMLGHLQPALISRIAGKGVNLGRSTSLESTPHRSSLPPRPSSRDAVLSPSKGICPATLASSSKTQEIMISPSETQPPVIPEAMVYTVGHPLSPSGGNPANINSQTMMLPRSDLTGNYVQGDDQIPSGSGHQLFKSFFWRPSDEQHVQLPGAQVSGQISVQERGNAPTFPSQAFGRFADQIPPGFPHELFKSPSWAPIDEKQVQLPGAQGQLEGSTQVSVQKREIP